MGDLRVDDAESLRSAARTLSMTDIAVVQHEYGIYGNDDGVAVVDLLRAVTAPSIVVFHTVLEAPSDRQRLILEQVAAAAGSVVVMTAAARELLFAHYDVDMSHVSVIPHGVPIWGTPAVAPRPDRLTMLTWGLIGPDKGLEWGIRAVADLREVWPPVHYEILGETHPKVVAHEGEAYRQRLTTLAAGLGVSDRIHFIDEYLSSDGIAAHVAAADLVLLPYDSRTQITSGVLVEAIAARKHVIATGFPHAVEMLGGADGPVEGTIVAHESSAGIAVAVRAFVATIDGARPQDAPHVAAPETSWAAIAERYRMLAQATRASSGDVEKTPARTA
ncbi:MAG: glycosyltransferase [Pseudolysinimonas sp.]